MKNPSLERFYLKINKSTLLAQSYTENKDFLSIVKTCRLKPLFEDNQKYKLILYKKWFDEFGNSLNIIKNKRLKIIYNDLSLRNKYTCTDLYFGLSMDRIVKLSKVVHLVIGINEDTEDYYFVATFLGLDNYLRSYMYDYEEWKQVSPLMLGIKKIKNIINYSDIKYFHNLLNKENFMTPCKFTDEWISCIPPSKDFLSVLKKKHDVDFSILLVK